MRKFILSTLAFGLLAALPAQAITPKEIIIKSQNIVKGDSTAGTLEMLIIKPKWKRKMVLKTWETRKGGVSKFFTRIISPKKEKGMGTLKIDKSMWNYLPRIEKVMKIPPSLMLQPWMGSDFSNDDMVQEISLEDDYKHKLLGEEKIGKSIAYKIELIPNPDVPVVWGKLHYFVEKARFLPMRQEFYNEKGKMIKVMNFSRVKKMHNRFVPTRMEMIPLNKKGHKTVMTYLDMNYDAKIPDKVFSLRNLKKP